MDFPFFRYKILLNDFPKSSFADNAAWTMLSFEENMSHPCGESDLNLEFIDKFKSWASRYPGSELMPDAYATIASLYLGYDAPYEELNLYTRHAYFYLKKLEKEYPDFSKWTSWSREDVENRLKNISWHLRIESESDQYTLGTDSIILLFHLEHDYPEPIPYELFQDTQLANFQLMITHRNHEQYDEYTYINPQRYLDRMDWTRIMVMAKPNTPYVERKNILRSASDHSWYPAHYTFNLPGIYTIRAYYSGSYQDISLESNEILITVR